MAQGDSMTCPDIKVPIGKGLSCGCCGTWFNAWKGYVHQDQDNGYGICKECQGWIGEKERGEQDKLIATLAGGLNAKNRADDYKCDCPLHVALGSHSTHSPFTSLHQNGSIFPWSLYIIAYSSFTSSLVGNRVYPIFQLG